MKKLKNLMSSTTVFALFTLIGYAGGVLISDTLKPFEFNAGSDTFLICVGVVGFLAANTRYMRSLVEY